MKLTKNKRIFEVLLWLYLLALPMMDLPKPHQLGAKIQYADIIFFFLFISWLWNIYRFKNVLFPSKKIIIILASLIVANLFSCLNSNNYSNSVLDYLGLVYLVGAFLLLSSALREKRLFSAAVLIVFLTSLVTSIIGIGTFILALTGQYSWARGFLLFTPSKAMFVPFPRLRSTFVLPEMFIVFSHLGMVCGIISSELQANLKFKKLFVIGTLVIITAALFSYSRSLSGFFVTLSIIILYKKDIWLPALVRGLTILITVILVTATVIFSIWTVFPVTVSRDVNTGSMMVTLSTSPDIRTFLRGAAFRIALQHPFFGIGQGMFTDEVKDYAELNSAKDTIKINQLELPLKIDPHCAYFGSIAETGFIGLLLTLAFFYFIITESIKSINEFHQPESRKIKGFLLAGFLGYLLTAWFVDIFSIRQFWISMALLVAYKNSTEIKDG